MAKTFDEFAPVAEERHDYATANKCRERSRELHTAVEAHGWDGAWYRRAYFDNGTPLGSATNDECQIDSIAQTWAVIAGCQGDRGTQAMAALQEKLVLEHDRLILLLAQPFDKGTLAPGYIKGYLPGIRENGGQYTHAAVWVVQATALLGRGGEAHALFDLLNPIRHAQSEQDVARYGVEPYVVAADIYGRPPHVGRGGWTWYTGSASWLYRVGVETLLGFQQEGKYFRLDPCVPADWPGFTMDFRNGKTQYRIQVENSAHVERGVARVLVDGHEVPGGKIELVDDGRDREVRVEMGATGGEALP
jgi:cellobiose phosphorylase